MGDRRDVLGLGLFVIFLSTLGVSNAFAEENFEEYENFIFGFNIDFPSDWIKIEPQDPLIKVIFMSPLASEDDEFQENVIIMREETIVQLSSTEYGKLVTEQMRSITPDFKLVESGSTIVSGTPYYKVTYTAKDEVAGNFKQTIFSITSEKSAYSIAMTTSISDYHDYFPTFEKMLETFTLREGPGPQLVTEQYVNQDAGFQLKLPHQWQGIEIITDELTTVVITPQAIPSDPSEFVMIIVVSMTNEVAASSDFAFGDDETCSMPKSALISEVFGMKALEFKMECFEPNLNLPIDTQNYGYISDENTISLTYGAASQATFDKYLPLFEKTLETLQIENVVDLSDVSSMAEAYDSRVISKSVLQEGIEKEILIVVKSDLHTFSFSDKSNSITFAPGVGVGSIREFATVYVNDVLSPPFKVSVNGEPAEDVLVVEDKTNGDVSIGFSYEYPVNKIEIVGSEKEKVLSDEKDSNQQSQIPDWVRGNAEWWAQGAIGDSDFVSGIQYLIKEGIMIIPETAQGTTSDDSQEIPSWIKNNADWWAQGLITDDDFVKGIQFLIENGIIRV